MRGFVACGVGVGLGREGSALTVESVGSEDGNEVEVTVIGLGVRTQAFSSNIKPRDISSVRVGLVNLGDRHP